jgi:hypothetical protein
MDDFYLQQVKTVMKITERHAAEAASRGSLRTLKYLYEIGAPFDAHSCYNAALNGHLICLKFLVETVECPYNYSVLLGLCHNSCSVYVKSLKPIKRFWCF